MWNQGETGRDPPNPNPRRECSVTECNPEVQALPCPAPNAVRRGANIVFTGKVALMWIERPPPLDTEPREYMQLTYTKSFTKRGLTSTTASVPTS